MHSNSRRPLKSGLIALLAVSILAAACSPQVPSTPPSAAPTTSSATSNPTPNSSADQAVYASIETQVEGLRELRSNRPVTPTLLDEKGVADWLAKANATQTDHVALAAESRLYVDLGLLPPGSSLEKLELDLESSQVIGFYDPDTKQLYVLSESGGVGVEQKITFAHEFTHALQDQNFGLDKLSLDTADQSDRDLARTSLAEGDATLSMTQWATKNMSLLDMIGIGTGPDSAAQTQQLAAAPAILRGTLLFPYEQGLTFVQAIYAAGGWAAVDKVYSRPPASSSQILHPELYTQNVQPALVTVPPVPAALGKGWKLAMQDTLGEYALGIWLEGEHPTSAAATSATGAVSTWSGDRIGLYEGPNGGWVVVLHTKWRTDTGRLEFMAAATARLDGIANPSRICTDAAGEGVDIAIASVQAALPTLMTCNPMD